MFSVRKPAAKPRGAPPVWFFDLDNTLHNASHAVFPEINRQMTAYVANTLSLDGAEASALRQHYWQRYGATLLGLIKHHGVDANDFLTQTHRFDDLPALLQAQAGAHQVLRRLPGRKLVVTNAPWPYASTVIVALKYRATISKIISIEQMKVGNRLRPKPSTALMSQLAAREGVRARHVVFVDDSLENLKAAKRSGMRTGWMTGWLGRKPAHKPAYVDFRLRDPRALLRFRR